VGSRHAGILLHSLTKVDVTETTASDLTTDAVLVPHAEVLHVVSGVVLLRSMGGGVVAWREGSGHAPWSSCLWLTSLMRRRSVECIGRWRAQ
jgi:hypothetical protein